MQMKSVNNETFAENAHLTREATRQPERINEDPDRHLIRHLLSLPPSERTNFLRVPLPNGGSAI
jgi:hypothetical protein